MKDSLVILWEGSQEWEIFDGTLEEARAYVKQDRRYENYGYTGATIIRATMVYQIRKEVIERTSD